MNVPWASTRAGSSTRSARWSRTSLGANDGMLRALRIVCPRGSVLNPEPPAAVSVRHNTCQRFADTLIRALAALWPEFAVAAAP